MGGKAQFIKTGELGRYSLLEQIFISDCSQKAVRYAEAFCETKLLFFLSK